MNAAVNEETVESPGAIGPGGRLKALREEREIELLRVAALLHLNEEKLRALEADDYQKLPGSVFVQGYLRNYARVMEVPVEPYIKAFHQAVGSQQPEPNLHVAQVRHEMRSSHLVIRLITWAIVIGLLALVITWWRGYLQWPVVSNPMENTESTALSEPSDAAEDGLPASEENGFVFNQKRYSEIDESGQAELALPGQQGTATEESPQTTDDSTPAAAGPQPVAVPQEMSATEAPAVAAESPPAAVEPAVADEGIRLTFTGTSWVEVRDATGSFKIMGEVGAGTERVLGGQPPYKVVFGNASAVRITVDGEVFDITPYIRGNVARFSLDP